MKLEIIDEALFSSFSINHPLKSFLQTPMVGKYRTLNGWDVIYMGLFEEDRLVGASMVASKNRFMGKKEYYLLRGPLLDYNNQTHVNYFFLELKKYIKDNNGFILRIDPYLKRLERDIDGKEVTGGFNNNHVIEYLKNLGFKRTIAEQVEWMFALPLDKSSDEIFKNLNPSTRSIIRNTLKTGVSVRKLSYEDLSIFKDITDETSKRKNFIDHSLNYYERMYELFKDEIIYMIAEVNLNEYIERLSKELEYEQAKRLQLSDIPINNGKLKELDVTINSLIKKIDDAKEIIKNSGEMLSLSVGMFITYGDEIIYLVSGNKKDYISFGGQYRIQWEMINYGINHDYKKYNFYGITGNFDPSDKDYGIYKFKRGFNGVVEELIGEYELKITYHYYLFKIANRLKELIRR